MRSALEESPVSLKPPRGDQEWIRSGGLFGCVALIHAVGWGLFFLYAPRFPAMAGLGALAYGLGLRHAFDADHISAIDDTIRFLLQRGKRPLAVGFFFSLGHSTIVLIMTIALIVATKTVHSAMPQLHNYGSVVSASVSGVFLWLIGNSEPAGAAGDTADLAPDEARHISPGTA
jgi:high-affinity nickel-transport protein